MPQVSKGKVSQDKVSTDKASREKAGPVSASLPSAEEEAFSAFWNAYPRKQGRQNAMKAYAKAVQLAEPEVLLQALQEQKHSPKRQKDGGQYVPLAAAWPNGRRRENCPHICL